MDKLVEKNSQGGFLALTSYDVASWAIKGNAYIATGRLPHGQPPPPMRGPLPRGDGVKTRMARKLRSEKGTGIYSQRKVIVEPVNGHIRENRGVAPDRRRAQPAEVVPLPTNAAGAGGSDWMRANSPDGNGQACSRSTFKGLRTQTGRAAPIRAVALRCDYWPRTQWATHF
jgi:hypothetical protein